VIISLFTRLLFAAYFLEAGLILIVAPWSAFWDRNFFAEALPALEGILASPFARGAVSGVGAITAVAGLTELGAVFLMRRRAGPQGDPHGLNSPQ
jgi:hypothetical protein